MEVSIYFFLHTNEFILFCQGASILTEPVRFTIGDHEFTSASHASTAGTISGIIAGIAAILLAALGIFFYKRRRADEKAANGVAFENPSYLRAIEQVQVSYILRVYALSN